MADASNTLTVRVRVRVGIRFRVVATVERSICCLHIYDFKCINVDM